VCGPPWSPLGAPVWGAPWLPLGAPVCGALWLPLALGGGGVGAAFAEPAPTPNAAAPKAPAMVAPATSCFSFMVPYLCSSETLALDTHRLGSLSMNLLCHASVSLLDRSQPSHPTVASIDKRAGAARRDRAGCWRRNWRALLDRSHYRRVMPCRALRSSRPPCGWRRARTSLESQWSRAARGGVGESRPADCPQGYYRGGPSRRGRRGATWMSSGICWLLTRKRQPVARCGGGLGLL
jgi:hypothetical protein